MPLIKLEPEVELGPEESITGDPRPKPPTGTGGPARPKPVAKPKPIFKPTQDPPDEFRAEDLVCDDGGGSEE